MNIEAAKRLRAVRIVDQEEHSEREGMHDLATYTPATHGKQLRTSYPGYTVAMRTTHTNKPNFIELFMLHDLNPIGYLELTRVALNGRQGDVFEPSTFFTKAYRRLVYVKALYQWVLDSGACLVTGSTQTPETNRLWGLLSQSYDCLVYKQGQWADIADESTKYLLLGKGRKRAQISNHFNIKELK